MNESEFENKDMNKYEVSLFIQFSDSGAVCFVSLEVPEKTSPALRFNWLESPPWALLPGVVTVPPETSMSTTMSSDSLALAPLLLGSAWLPGAGLGVEPIWSSDSTKNNERIFP